jgi:hypothetical protein
MKDDMLYVGYFSKKEKKKREERPYIKQPKKERERENWPRHVACLGCFS